ncbi:hypothetical protein L195_g029846 [Trifolium pratense]|uniref:Uncharacterized protein n=1 Tax=Trifolium pratense TaxID=57577 RepID=A0A2K3L5X5_TRIPR|nr:hypothetical protein L195_g029846 [Trifolium pratense]
MTHGPQVSFRVWGGVGVAEAVEGVGGGDVWGVGAYQLMTSHASITTDAAENLIWHSQLTHAFLDVERPSQPITYSSLAVLLVLFGI